MKGPSCKNGHEFLDIKCLKNFIFSSLKNFSNMGLNLNPICDYYILYAQEVLGRKPGQDLSDRQYA